MKRPFATFPVGLLGLVFLGVLLYSCGCGPITYRPILAFERPNINCVLMEHHIAQAASEWACPLPQATNLTPDAPCDETLWRHVYHQKRLQVKAACISVTGTFMDASRGREKDGCRHEADADAHCWLRLDKGQEGLLNDKNIVNQDGNLVLEPICRYPVTQADAKKACQNWKQDLTLPLPGAHIRVTGAYVLDTQHGWRELHPISRIEVIP